MIASEVLQYVKEHHSKAAFVPELTVTDPWALSNHDEESTPNIYHRRIDALMMMGYQLTALEIKVSRADVKRDDWYKTLPWRRLTHRYIYAVPAGLIESREVPFYEAGLWWVHEDGKVEVKRKARINNYPEPLPLHVIQNMMYRIAGNTRFTLDS